MELLAVKTFNQRKSRSLLSFSFEGTEHWPKWYRFLSWDGQPLIKIGNICGTCGFFFERISGATGPHFALENLRETLSLGLGSIENGIDLFSPLIPKGKYAALLLRVQPVRVSPGQANDYFYNEYAESWDDADEHDPSIEYYFRDETHKLRPGEKLYEFLIPFQDRHTLDEARITEFEKQLKAGEEPTAIAVGILDVKESMDDIEEPPEFSVHWSFANYILDGHHKIEAAARAEKPMTILTFVSYDHSWKHVDELIAFYQNGKISHGPNEQSKTNFV